MKPIISLSRFDRYLDNLSLVETEDGYFVKSYDTLVAEVDYETSTLYQLGWWSVTTQKHINYAAHILGLKLKN